MHLHGERAGDLCGAAAIDDGVVAHEVAGDAEGVVQAALDLVQDHLVAAAHKDGHRAAVGAVLDHQHAVFCRAERQLAHDSGPTCHIPSLLAMHCRGNEYAKWCGDAAIEAAMAYESRLKCRSPAFICCSCLSANQVPYREDCAAPAATGGQQGIWACLPAQLVRRKLGEAGDDAGARGHGQQLQLHSTHPANRRQIIGHQQVVGLVIKTPASHSG